MADDRLTAALAEIREREQAATPGPWWCDDGEQTWRLHGVAGYVPMPPEFGLGDQVINKQILKAPKTGTPYSEYWPDPPDAEFIAHAREDVRRLLAVVDKVLKRHYPALRTQHCIVCAEPYPCTEVQDITAALTGETDHD